MPPIFAAPYPSLTDSVSERIAEILKTRRDPFAAPVGVIVPSRSAAESVSGAVLRKVGKGVSGLAVRTLESLAQELVNAGGRYPRVASPEERRLAMFVAHRTTEHHLGSTHGLEAILERSYRDLRDSGLTLDQFEQRVDRAHQLSDRTRLREAAAIWREYEKIIRNGTAIDPADLFLLARAALVGGGRPAPPHPPSQIVFGFYDATGVQTDFIRLLGSRNLIDSIYLPIRTDGNEPASDYRFAELFTAAMCDLAGESIQPLPMPDPPEVSIRHSGSRREEALEALRLARSLAGSVNEKEYGGGRDARPPVAIVARSLEPRDLRLLENAAAEFGLRLESKPSLSLTAQRIGRGLNLLIQLPYRRFPRRDVLELLRCAFRATSCRTGDLDWLEESSRHAEIAEGNSKSLEGAAARLQRRYRRFAPGVEKYLRFVEELERITAPVARPLSARGWGEAIEKLVTHFRPETAADCRAVDEIRRVASLLRASGAADSPLDADTVAGMLEEQTIEIEHEQPSDAQLPVIWTGDIMKFRGRSVRHLLVIRTQNDLLPQRRVDDPLLPDRDRTTLGVRLIGDGRDEENLLFRLMLDSATANVTFSFATADGRGKALRPSQLLKNYAADRERDPAQQKLILRDFVRYLSQSPSQPPARRSRSELRTAQLLASPTGALIRRLRLASDGETASIFDGFVPPGERLESRLRAIFDMVSPTHLEHLGECPQKFFMTTVLGLDEVEDPQLRVELEIRKRGQLDHTVLENFYKTITENDLEPLRFNPKPVLPEELRTRLQKIAAEVFTTHDEQHPPANSTIRAIERTESGRQLERFVAEDLHQLAQSGFRPREFELRFGDEPDDKTILEIAGLRLAIRGMIDRVDQSKYDGSLRVVDYKSGRAIGKRKLPELIDKGHALQLPLYALVAERLFGTEASKITGVIRPLREKIRREALFAFALGDKKEVLLENLGVLVRSVLRGEFPAFPDPKGCRYCVANAFCRAAHEPNADQLARKYEFAIAMIQEREGQS